MIPRDTSRLIVWSAVGAFVVLAAGVGLYLAGWKRAASPGPLAGSHGTLDSTCAQCHSPRNQVADLRCERCHDPIDNRRFTPAAHVVTGTDDGWKASHGPDVTCAVCHADHRGRSVALHEVGDRPCATCHTFGSFAGHPEFAPVRAAMPSTVGLRFPHAKHVGILTKLNRPTCISCHVQTADERGFQPVAFDDHCASCHLTGGVLTINGTKPIESSAVEAALLMPYGTPTVAVGAADGRKRQVLGRLPHRDAWILERAGRLSEAIDSTGAEAGAARVRVRQAIGAAQAAAAMEALTDMTREELERWADGLAAELAAIDKQLATPRGQLSAESSAALKELAAALGQVDPALSASVDALPAAPPAAAPESDAERRRQLEAARDQLRPLLAAITARGDERARKTAAAITARLEALAPSTAASTAADERALLDRLRALEGLIRLIEPQTGAAQAADLRRAVQLARQQIAPGVASDEFLARQSELVQLLLALAAKADPVMKRRVDDLRTALTDLETAGLGADTLARRRDDKARLLERVRIQMEIGSEPNGPQPARIGQQLAAMRSHITALEASLAPRDGVAPLDAPLATDADRAKRGLNAMLAGCLFCHTLNKDNSAMLPVRQELGMLSAANFSHKPHASQACETCHTGTTSIDTSETFLPAITKCQTCHRPGQSRADCASCHTYHPRNASVGAAWR